MAPDPEWLPSAADPFDYTISAVTQDEYIASGSSEAFVTGPAMSQQGGYGPLINLGAAVAAADAGPVGVNLGGAPANPGSEVVQMQAEATLAADVLEGTVPASDFAFLISSHAPLEFIGQNTVQVGASGAAGTWDYNAPTRFEIPNAGAFSVGNTTVGPGDWINMLMTVHGLGAAEIGSGVNIPQALATAAGFPGIPNADVASMLKVASNISYGENLYGSVASGNIDGLTLPHYGVAPG